MRFDMNWETILTIRAWTSLREVAPQSEMVLPGVYRVAENAYLVTQPYNRAFEQNLPEAPFVTMAIWAESTNALRRCVNSDATAQVQTIGTKPPEILLLGTQGKYAELAQRIPQTKQKIAERAVYSNTGDFVHKVIEIDRFCFCFLNQKITKEEGAYVVEVSLH
jgi:hypothetical protein